MTYRQDIDGLRAIAVLLVLFFHCQIPGFGGGYVGVDVFFVISGFLITRILLDDLQAGTFTFRGFYVRRVRRLLPALMATILLTLAAGMAILTPAHLAEAGASAAFAALSLSNVYFTFATSYFGAEAEIAPLLHTWSLSVEEQFYLVWPLALVGLMRLGGRWLVLGAVLAGLPAGLALSEYWVANNLRGAYFLPMFRVHQFLAGAALVWMVDRRLPRPVEVPLFLVGLAAVMWSGMTYTDRTSFPGLASLPPTIGTVLLLWCGRAPGLSRLLTNRPAVAIGQISYSVYLVHWPLVVFWRYLSVEPFRPWEQAALVALSLAGGAVLFVAVERRFRLRRGDPAAAGWRPLQQMLRLTAAAAAAGFAMQATGGLPQRMALAPRQADYAAASAFHFADLHRDGILTFGAGEAGAGSGSARAGEAAGPDSRDGSGDDGRDGRRVLIFGDSMMQNYIPALLELPGIAGAEVHVISRGGCVMARDAILIIGGTPDRKCRDLRDAVHALPGRFDLVVWTQKWLDGYDRRLWWQTAPDGGRVRAFRGGQADMAGWRDGVARTLDHFVARSDRIVLIGPQLKVSGVNPALRRVGPLAPVDRVAATIGDIARADQPARPEIAAGLAALAAGRPTVQYVDPEALICPGGTCRFTAPPYSLFMDPIHHSRAATPFLRDRFAEVAEIIDR